MIRLTLEHTGKSLAQLNVTGWAWKPRIQHGVCDGELLLSIGQSAPSNSPQAVAVLHTKCTRIWNCHGGSRRD